MLRKPARADAVAATLSVPRYSLPVESGRSRISAVTPLVSPVRAGQSVLVVEDEELNAKLVCALLRKLGLATTHVRDGRAAVEMARGQAFSFILMDLQMPVLDGLGATACIREDEAPSGRRTPIIALTANAMSGDRDRCVRAGMDDYLSKPISPRDLEAVVNRYAPAGAGSQAPDGRP
jgi:two-component system sensor histidine kinase/response regulator